MTTRPTYENDLAQGRRCPEGHRTHIESSCPPGTKPKDDSYLCLHPVERPEDSTLWGCVNDPNDPEDAEALKTCGAQWDGIDHPDDPEED